MSLLQKAVLFNAKAQSREVAIFLRYFSTKISKNGLIFVKKAVNFPTQIEPRQEKNFVAHLHCTKRSAAQVWRLGVKILTFLQWSQYEKNQNRP
jgi:hypothetical protein